MTQARRTTTTAQRVTAVVVGVLVALPLALVALLATAGPAQASTYRYWTYWWGTNTGKPHDGWRFAPQGATSGVGDGWVLGWRFATSTVAGGKQPRTAAAYSDLCHDPVPTDGSVRVALVIDYGTSADAPPGEQPPRSGSVQLACLILPARSTGVTALREAEVSVRQNSDGLICGLNGYPRVECAPVIPDPTPTPTAKPTVAKPKPTPTLAAGGAPTARSLPGPSSTRASSSPVPLATTGTTAATSSAAAATTGSPSAGAESADPGESVLPAVAGSPQPDAQSSGSPLGLVVGLGVIAAIAGSAWWTSRRRSLR
jgi:hypothetical protein